MSKASDAAAEAAAAEAEEKAKAEAAAAEAEPQERVIDHELAAAKRMGQGT